MYFIRLCNIKSYEEEIGTIMTIRKPGIAGTLESSDIMITIKPADEIMVNLISSVSQFYGESIMATIKAVLEESGVKGAEVEAVDHGALDCTIRARVYAAVERACEKEVKGR